MSDFLINTDTINNVYRMLLNEAAFNPTWENIIRGLKILDLGPKVVRFTLPRMNILTDKSRKLNYAFMFRELWWYLTGDNRLFPLKKFNHNIEQFSDDGKYMFGAYGPWIVKGMETVILKLFEDRLSRQAIITVYQLRHGFEKSKDVPCTLTFHFISYDGIHLNMITHMRSQDLWWGFPYDIANFSTILVFVATSLGFKVGELIHIVDTLHIYESKLKAIQTYLSSKFDDLGMIIIDNFKPQFTGYQRSIELLDKFCSVDYPLRGGILNTLLSELEYEPTILKEHIAFMVKYLIKVKKEYDLEAIIKFQNILDEINSPLKGLN